MSFHKILVSSIAAAAVATSSFAGTASLSATSKGDYLVYPAYYATTDGWTTNIRVVNTNVTQAVVAKVVVREYATSKELLDFPIYLTPGDVWTADLVNDGSSVKVVSSDDSSPEVPMSQALYNNNPLVGTAYGYVEVLAVAQKEASAIDATWSQYKPLDKAKMKADYALVTSADHNAWIAAEGQLFGQQVVTANTAGAEKSMTLMATAFRVVPTTIEDAARNISTSAVFATDTLAASVFGFADVDAQIRAELEKTRVHAINYTSTGAETQILLTQATKHTNPDVVTTDLDVPPYYDTTATEKAETGSQAKFYFVGRTWDESENTYTKPGSIYSGTQDNNSSEKCVTEICYVYYSDLTDSAGPINTTYASGWVDLTLGTNDQGNGNLAVPTISTIMTGVKVNGVGIVNMLPSAYEAAAN